MSFGMMIRDSSGRIFATPDTPILHFTTKQTFTHTGSPIGQIFSTGIASSVRIVVYTRLNSAVACHAQQYISGGYWVVRIRSSAAVSGTFYIFTDNIPHSSGGWGLELYDATGRLTYSTSAKPLQNKTVALNKDGTSSVNLGHATAVIAVPQMYWWRMFGSTGVLNLEASCAYGNIISLLNMGAGFTASFAHGTTFLPNGNTVNYINAGLYD